jgi:hypothetical protein
MMTVYKEKDILTSRLRLCDAARVFVVVLVWIDIYICICVYV